MLGFLALFSFALAQNEYASISFSGGSGHIYDRGLSALRYSGLNIKPSGGYLRETPKYKIHFTGTYDMGAYLALVEGSIYSLKIQIPEFSGRLVFRLPVFHEGSPWKMYAGAHIFNRTNLISNSHLFNNAFTTNNITTFSTSAELERVSHHAEKYKKFLFVRYTIPEWDGRWNWSLHAGLINLNFRPQFAYMYHFPNTNMDLMESYRLFVGGFHMMSSLGYTWYLPNGNGIALSYDWDAYTTGQRDYHLLNGGTHLASFTLLFKTN